MAAETRLVTSTTYVLKRIGLAAAGIGIGGIILLNADEFLLYVIGGAFAIGGAAMAVMPIFVGLGGIGPCPICGSTIEANDRSQKNLLCKGCTSYIDAENKKLRKSPADRITQVPVFAAPTPWSDLRLVLSPTIALSTQDYVANLLMSKKGNVRMLPAQWPKACCVCGKAPRKAEKYARTIMVPPSGIGVRDTETVVAAEDVPYCEAHSGGIQFDTIHFSNPENDAVFAILFRSLAYRNEFMRLNGWSWGA
jgi:hypothetical protein